MTAIVTTDRNSKRSVTVHGVDTAVVGHAIRALNTVRAIPARCSVLVTVTGGITGNVSADGFALAMLIAAEIEAVA